MPCAGGFVLDGLTVRISEADNKYEPTVSI
jgi:hypothetical protein